MTNKIPDADNVFCMTMVDIVVVKCGLEAEGWNGRAVVQDAISEVLDIHDWSAVDWKERLNK